MRLARLVLPPSIVISLAAACGGEGDSVFDTDAGAGDAGGLDEDASFVFDDAAAPSCPSQVLCGARGACCQSGEQCIDGVCSAACSSGVRCAAGCCATGQVCLSAACVAPGATCTDSFDCEENQFCEPTVGRCLPQPSGANSCVIRPPTPAFEPVVKWSWTASAIKPEFDQVINMPVVIDLDGDKVPEVLVVTSRNDQGFGHTDKAFLRALDGRTGAEVWPATADVYKEGQNGEPDYTVNPRGTPAAADLDGDGKVEIIVPRRTGGVLAFNANGSFRGRSTLADGTTDYDGVFESVTVALADMDHDGKGEVVLAGVVLDHNLKLVTDASRGREKWGSNDSGYGAVSVIADIDDDAASTAQYVVTGNRAIRKDGTLKWDVSGALGDGYTAIADLDKDGIPELVVTLNVGGVAKIRVQNAQTGALIGSVLDVPGNGRGGPPTIADFDGDGFMEIASANGSKYNVFEFATGTKQLSVKWSHDTQDQSSNVTGSSVFDFEGDGTAEVVYNDECYARVYNGTDGGTLLEIPNSTGTIHEYPVIADVNGDNRTEFVVVANDRNHKRGLSCPSLDGGAYTPRHGVFVYGDPNNKWVRTRRIWNQHAYHISNIESDGKLPRPESQSWGPNGLNNYRVSSQGKGAFNAPDLRVDLEVSTAPCPERIELRARVKNAGTLGVPAGVSVTFRRGVTIQGSVLGRKQTTRALLPGESEVMTLGVGDREGAEGFSVDVAGSETTGVVNECLTDNNGAVAGRVSCPRVR